MLAINLPPRHHSLPIVCLLNGLMLLVVCIFQVTILQIVLRFLGAFAPRCTQTSSDIFGVIQVQVLFHESKVRSPRRNSASGEPLTHCHMDETYTWPIHHCIALHSPSKLNRQCQKAKYFFIIKPKLYPHIPNQTNMIVKSRYIQINRAVDYGVE